MAMRARRQGGADEVERVGRGRGDAGPHPGCPAANEPPRSTHSGRLPPSTQATSASSAPTAAPPRLTTTSSRRRSTRSARTPAGMPNSSMARKRTAKMAPTASGSVVMTRVTHANTTLLSAQRERRAAERRRRRRGSRVVGRGARQCAQRPRPWGRRGWWCPGPPSADLDGRAQTLKGRAGSVRLPGPRHPRRPPWAPCPRSASPASRFRPVSSPIDATSRA